MTPVPDHNHPRWLTVAAWPEVRRRWTSLHGKSSDWCVMRLCPCHYREAVTIPLPNRKRAERAYSALVQYAGEMIR